MGDSRGCRELWEIARFIIVKFIIARTSHCFCIMVCCHVYWSNIVICHHARLTVLPTVQDTTPYEFCKSMDCSRSCGAIDITIGKNCQDDVAAKISSCDLHRGIRGYWDQTAQTA